MKINVAGWQDGKREWKKKEGEWVIWERTFPVFRMGYTIIPIQNQNVRSTKFKTILLIRYEQSQENDHYVVKKNINESRFILIFIRCYRYR